MAKAAKEAAEVSLPQRQSRPTGQSRPARGRAALTAARDRLDAAAKALEQAKTPEAAERGQGGAKAAAEAKVAEATKAEDGGRRSRAGQDPGGTRRRHAAWDAENASDVAAATPRRVSAPPSRSPSSSARRRPPPHPPGMAHDPRGARHHQGARHPARHAHLSGGRARRPTARPCAGCRHLSRRPTPARADDEAVDERQQRDQRRAKPQPVAAAHPGRTRRRRVRSIASRCARRRSSSSPTGCGPAPRSSSPTTASATKPASTPTSSCSRAEDHCRAFCADKPAKAGL